MKKLTAVVLALLLALAAVSALGEAVMTHEQYGRVNEIVGKATAPLCAGYQRRIADAGKRVVLPYVREDLLEEFVHWTMESFFNPICWILYYGLNSDEHPLDIPDDYSKSSKGICIYIAK